MSAAVQQSSLMQESASEASSAALEVVDSPLYAAHYVSAWSPISRRGKRRQVSQKDSQVASGPWYLDGKDSALETYVEAALNNSESWSINTPCS